MKKYVKPFLLLCSLLMFMTACGSPDIGGRTTDGASKTQGTAMTVHSGGCFVRDGDQASPADIGQSNEPPRWQKGSSPYFGAVFVSCQDTINLSWSGGFDFYQIIWSRPGMSDQQFSTHWQDGVDFTNAHFSTIYTFKVEGCHTNVLIGSSCSDWAPTVKVATYYPGDCHVGYVWRSAFASDHVCVTPATRDQTASDNSQASSRVNPSGAYGPDTCIQGYVWRGVVDSDHVCVTPATHAQVVYDNAHAAENTY